MSLETILPLLTTVILLLEFWKAMQRWFHVWRKISGVEILHLQRQSGRHTVPLVLEPLRICAQLKITINKIRIKEIIIEENTCRSE